MKEIIDDFISNNNAIADLIESISESYQDGNEVLPHFAEKLKQTQYNIALGNSFGDLLQLSNNKEIYEKFSLEDISRLYSSLLKIQDANLENYVDAAYFEASVMVNFEKAKQIVNEGLQKARQKVEELQRLLETINDEQNNGA